MFVLANLISFMTFINVNGYCTLVIKLKYWLMTFIYQNILNKLIVMDIDREWDAVEG